MFRNTLLLAAALIATVVSLASAETASDEVYRIRIRNKPNGLVQVSMDQGRTYATVGRVKVAANARITGFGASAYAPQGTVAATAVHGIRIKTGQSATGLEKAQVPLMFSITPRQFGETPRGYGGHVARSSGILTDIDVGRAIFRNLSPYVGNQVFVERQHGLLPLPEDYIPREGETIVIVVTRPSDTPSEIDFENRAGGSVTAIYPDGTSKPITKVARPVRGAGRYDATTYTGIGAINTNHCGVITISTAPAETPETKEGGPTETRGGFMIQPHFHVIEQNESSPQVMVIGPEDKSRPHLEGTPPLFSGYINLSRYPGHPNNSYRAQVRINGGDWQDAPRVIGKADNALASVTDVRILFPQYDAKLTAAELKREADAYTARATSGMRSDKGTLTFGPRSTAANDCVVTLYVDGAPVNVSNRYPYTCSWDSTRTWNGLHCIEVEAVPAGGGDPIVETKYILVRN